MTGSPKKSYASSAGSAGSQRTPTSFTIADELSVEEYGRTFNAYREGKYLLPNDGEEQDRLDLQHKIWLLILNDKLSLAPISEPADALDIGTGTGIWAKQFAKQHPNTKVVGTDLSLIQASVNTPPNCTFVREDSEELWIHDHPFDYIHWRLMFTCFNNIKGMFTKIYENLRPGGWAEFHEALFELVPESPASEEFIRNSAFSKYNKFGMKAGMAYGRDFMCAAHFKEWMIEAGFEDVVKVTILVPLNAWPTDPKDKIVGSWFSLNLLKTLNATSKILQDGGLPAEDVPGFLEEVRQDATNANMRAYIEHLVYYGRKPHAEEPSTAQQNS